MMPEDLRFLGLIGNWLAGSASARIMGRMENMTMVKISKRMSRALRHDPGRVGLTLDSAGWVEVQPFLAAMRISRAQLDEVVAGNDKQRFAILRGPDGVERIRASQGHSVPVDLGLMAIDPPAVLYHGTGRAALASILATGLNRGNRHDVHLSGDLSTARRVAQRRSGPIVVLTVAAGAMAAAGHRFFRSDNGVWLTAAVPVQFLEVLQ